MDTCKDTRTHVLCGSPIHQKPAILQAFLHSLKMLERVQISVSYYFIDDNIDERSSLMLEQFAEDNERVIVEPSGQEDEYEKNENHHVWNEKLIWKVAGFKNRIIEHARKQQYDFLFLMDSDLVLKPPTLQHLISVNKDIVSEIFWTRWEPDFPALPQVWQYDQYNLHPIIRGKEWTDRERVVQQALFLNKLKQPGLYEVGGLGACTLISRHAINKGVNFHEIKNISFVGEDRHFCIRAAALGIPLYVDTHYPAFHIYRESDLEQLKAE